MKFELNETTIEPNSIIGIIINQILKLLISNWMKFEWN